MFGDFFVLHRRKSQSRGRLLITHHTKRDKSIQLWEYFYWFQLFKVELKPGLWFFASLRFSEFLNYQLKLAQTYYKCSASNKTCIELKSRQFEVNRFRRAIFGNSDPDHVCKMRCVCDPAVASSISQGSAVKQKGKQEQKVSVPQDKVVKLFYNSFITSFIIIL